VVGVAGFAGWCKVVARRLPFGLARVVRRALSVALINGCTFAVDLVLLGLLHGLWR
jgi:hypothetical protein